MCRFFAFVDLFSKSTGTYPDRNSGGHSSASFADKISVLGGGWNTQYTRRYD